MKKIQSELKAYMPLIENLATTDFLELSLIQNKTDL